MFTMLVGLVLCVLDVASLVYNHSCYKSLVKTLHLCQIILYSYLIAVGSYTFHTG